VHDCCEECHMAGSLLGGWGWGPHRGMIFKVKISL
jgi:hypothetical protein